MNTAFPAPWWRTTGETVYVMVHMLHVQRVTIHLYVYVEQCSILCEQNICRICIIIAKNGWKSWIKAESKSDNSWEEHSIDEDIMHPSDSGSGSSDDDSSPEEEPNEDDRDQEAVEIRGAQPYRFEPLVPPDQRRDRPDDDAGERGEGDQDRLHNTDC